MNKLRLRVIDGETRTAGELTPEEQTQVYEDYKDGMSFSKLEEKYGMRPSNGMNAYRIVKKMESPSGYVQKKTAKKTKKKATKKKKASP